MLKLFLCIIFVCCLRREYGNCCKASLIESLTRLIVSGEESEELAREKGKEKFGYTDFFLGIDVKAIG